MAINFPSSPTNGQNVTISGVTYSWNSTTSTWDLVNTATASVAVTAPVTNTGTSTAAVLGIKTSPAFTGDGTNNLVEFKNSAGTTRTWVSAAGNELFVGGNSNDSASVQIGSGATGNQYAYIDMIGDTTYGDYGARLLRNNTGANSSTILAHRGTGPLTLTSQDAGSIELKTADVARMSIDSSGVAWFNNLIVAKPNNGGTLVNSNETGGLSIRSATGTNAASMSFHRPGIYAINMGLDTDNGFKIGGWSQGSTPYFQINTNGYLSTPSQVFCWISNSNTGNVTYGAGAVVRFDTPRHNIGSAYSTSTNRFTAPVAGRYHVWFTAYNQMTGAGSRVAICINGGQAVGTGATAGYQEFRHSATVYLNANDYVDVRVQYANTVLYLAGAHTEFGATLLG